MFDNSYTIKPPVYLQTLIQPTKYEQIQNNVYSAYYSNNQNNNENNNNINTKINQYNQINGMEINHPHITQMTNPMIQNNKILNPRINMNNTMNNPLIQNQKLLQNIQKQNAINEQINNQFFQNQDLGSLQIISRNQNKIINLHNKNNSQYHRQASPKKKLSNQQLMNQTMSYKKIQNRLNIFENNQNDQNIQNQNPQIIPKEQPALSSKNLYQPSPTLQMIPLETNEIKNEENKYPVPRDSSRNLFKRNKSHENSRNQFKSKSKKKNNINQLRLNEQILLRNQRENLNKDLDIKAHFDIEVTQEQYLFNYKKVLKIAMPLLSHYEMPSDCEYKSPFLSPDGQYLSCIAKSKIDSVFVWDLDDLYWFKYRFSQNSKVGAVAFTPDSKSILIVYKQSNPILYSLENGRKLLELEKNEDDTNKDGLNFAFTVKGAHFGYTTENGFTLWGMKTGKIKIKIKDESPIKLLFNEYLLSIKKDLNVKILDVKTSKTFLTFKLKGIQNTSDILDCRCTVDMSAFIYVIKKGVIKYIFKEKKFKGLQKFQPGVEKATISDDCRFVVKTNMRNLTIYDIEKGDTIGTILKEKFNEFRIDFNNEKLIVIDNLCINIHDYTDGGIPEQFVWLNKNPNKFLDAKFSHDFKFLFALIDKNYVVAYDLNTGLIIKKWQNVDKKWTNFSISQVTGNKTASNSNVFLVKVWNYITGREDATFYGFDSYSFHFSSDGNYLACGAKNGPEIARIWNIEKGTFGSFPYVGNNSNFHTIVHLTSPEPTRLICCSIDQQPLIFDTNSKELLYKCECLYRFEEVYEIMSDQKYDVFIVKGRDVKKREIGLMYRISDGILLEEYENYTILELAKDHGVVISKCDNINGGKLTATDVKNLSDPILSDFQIQTDKIKLLNDNKSVIVVTNSDDDKTEYCLMNAEDGGYFGRINFVKKTERNSENYITVDPVEEYIYFRYFEFLSPQESKDFRNKIFFRKSKL